jgi:hypothetical protein
MRGFHKSMFSATLSRFLRFMLELISQNYFTVCGVEEVFIELFIEFYNNAII